MKVKTERKMIDDLDVQVTQIAAMPSLDLLAKLGDLVGPAMAQIAGLLPGENSPGQINAAALSPVVESIFQQIGKQGIRPVLSSILSCVVVWEEGKSLPLSDEKVVNGVFTGRLLTLAQVVRFSLEVNYGDFFELLRSVVGDKMAKLSSSTQISNVTGRSGDSGLRAS